MAFGSVGAVPGRLGLVPGLSAIVGGDEESGSVAVLRATVGAPKGFVPGACAADGAPMGAVDVASRMVGTGAPTVGAPALRSGIVGAGTPGAGAGGGPPAMRSEAVGAGTVGDGVVGREVTEGAVAVGGTVGMGGLTGGANGIAEDGTAGGESAAFKVTRTVSFLRGTLEVCLDGRGDWLSFSLKRAGF